jgi:CheY-like chemotaxis protein
VTVEDDGAGFDTEILRRKEAAESFGLFSIRERLDVIGGRLSIASQPGKGTIATIVAPCRRPGPAGTPADSATERALPAGAATTRTTRIRVLLADDHPLVRKGIADLLMEHPDLNVLGEAGNGQEALDKAVELQPDVVLMDVTMPVMDGIEATRRIQEAAPGIRIIGLSMHEDEDMAARMKAAGAMDYVTKSAPSEEILSAILRACPHRCERYPPN